MALPVITPTGAPVSYISNRYVVQVDTASSWATPSWVTVFGQKSFGFRVNGQEVDNSTVDTGLWGSRFTVGFEWEATLNIEHESGTVTVGVEDAGQAFLRTRAAPTGVLATSRTVHLRWFTRDGSAEVFEGWAKVTWEPTTAEKDTDKVTVNIAGSGALYGNGDTTPLGVLASPIAVEVAPTVSSASPTAQTEGGMVIVVGSNFTGATQVKFGASNATSYIVQSDNVIAAVVPAGSAGSAAITVINAIGTSNSLPYTRGA